MRHSDIKLTMNIYTDERPLDAAGAVEMLPELGSVKGDGNTPRSVTPVVILESTNLGQNGSNSGKIGGVERRTNQRFTGPENAASNSFDNKIVRPEYKSNASVH